MLARRRHLPHHRPLLTALTLAVCLATIPVEASSDDARELLFPLLAAPDAVTEPRPADEVLSDEVFSGTRAWSCRNDIGLALDHGNDEADLLLRLVASLELARDERLRLVDARRHLRDALRSLDSSHTAPLARLASAEEQLERVEDDLLNRFTAALAKSEMCSDTERLVHEGLALAEVMELADALSVSVQGATRELIGRLLFARSRAPMADGDGASITRLTTLRDDLHAEESQWVEHSATIAALLGRHRRTRGVVAAFYSEHLATVEKQLRRQDDPTSELAADALTAVIIRGREYAARNHPSFLSAAPGFLDISGLADDAPRRVAAERIIASLGDQLPLLAELHQASVRRTELVAANPAGRSLEVAAAPLREPLTITWYRLSRVADLLASDDLSELERGWCWSEIGRLRDRVLSLERINIAFEEGYELWHGDSPPAAAAEFAEIVRNEALLIARIESGKTAESPEIVALDRYGEQLAASAVATLDELMKAAEASVGTASAGEAHRAARTFRAWIAAQRTSLEAGLPAGGPLRELAEPLRTLAAQVPLPFSTAADSFRALPDLERLVDRGSDSASTLQHLATLSAPAEVDRAVLELAGSLGLPVRPELTTDELRLVVGSDEARYVIRHPLPGISFVPAGFELGSSRMLFAPPAFLLAADADAEIPFWQRPSTIPPEWDRSVGERIMAVPVNIGNEVIGSGWVYGTCIAVALLPVPDPYTKAAAAQVFKGTLVKDLIAGTSKGLAETFLTDPRDIDYWKRAAGWMRWSTDVVDIGSGYSSWKGAATVEKAGEAMQLGAGIGDTFKGTVQLTTSPTDPFPYQQNILDASRSISQALDIARICEPADWAVIKGHLDQAAARDPHRQARAWSKVGDTLMELAYTCPEKLAPYGGTDPLETALDALDEQTRACNPDAARAKLNQCRSPVYTALRRCLCRHDFETEVHASELVLLELERGVAMLDGAEASCEPSQAEALARQLIAWTDDNASLFSCAADMRGRADEIVAWAATAGGSDQAAVLAEARREIEICHLDAAAELLGPLAAPSRCPDADQPTAEIRQELLGLIARRKEHDRALETIASAAEGAIDSCDVEWAETSLAELTTLEPCAEGKHALIQRLQSFVGDGNADDAEVSRIDAAATTAMAGCDTDLAENLLAALEPLAPCLTRNQERQVDLAGRLRFFTEQGADATGDDQLIVRVQEEFNSAVHDADRACDMTVARQHLEAAREILVQLSVSPCRSPYLDTFDQLVSHGQFVEEKIEERESLMRAIRSSAAAAESAFDAAMVSCEPSDLARAVGHAGDAIRTADSIAVLSGEGCADIVALVADADGLRGEAETLISYWNAIDADLQSARQAAAEGRSTAVGVYCAGVRQKAQPSRCFADALGECDSLGGADPGVQPDLDPSPLTTGTGAGSITTTTSTTGGGGSGRVQIAGAEPCAQDMSWVPERQRFECTCPGYHLDAELGRCVTGAAQVHISQADCDAGWPGTLLQQDPASGGLACKCPSGSAWSTIQNRCLDLLAGNDQAVGGDCSHMPGTLLETSTGRCRCTVGTWDSSQGRCVDAAARERERNVADSQKAAACERLYSNIQVFGSSSDSLHQQMAARSLSEARSSGCDPSRIAQAVARGARNPWSPGGGGGSTGTGGGGGGPTGQTPGGGPGAQANATCHIVNYQGQGDAFLVYEQHAEGNHHNVYVIPINEDDEDDVAELRAYWNGLPGFQFIGRFGSYSAAKAAADRVCAGKTLV